MIINIGVITMEKQTLAEKVKEVIELRRKSHDLPSEVLNHKSYHSVFGSARCSLNDLGNVASLLCLLPFIFYNKETGEVDQIGDQKYFYGIISFQEYIADVFDKKMKESNLAQGELGKRAKLAPSTISMILSGKRTCSTSTLEKMAESINLFPVYLVPKSPGAPPPDLYKDQVDQLTRLFRSYVLLPDSEVRIEHLRQSIEYGERIGEWTEALRAKYSVIKSNLKK